MFTSRSFTLDVSYSQVAVFDRSLERPFNFWTDRHVAQGFAWRPRSVSFGTLEDGLHHISVMVTPEDVDISSSAARAIQVPFKVPLHGEIKIASIADSVPLQLPSQLYALRFECSVGNTAPEIKLIFTTVDSPIFKIMRSDAQWSPADELLLTASPA
jgi:Competence protein J (ComJ)